MSGYCIKNQLENKSFKRNKEVKMRSVPARAVSFGCFISFLLGSISSFLILNSGKDCKGWRSQFRSVAKE